VASQHLAAEPLAELTAHVRPFVDEARFPDAVEHLEAVVDTLRTRLATYGDVNTHLGLLYPEGEALEKRRSMGADPEIRRVLEAVRARLVASSTWEGVALDQAVRGAGMDVGVKGAQLFHPVRVLLIGSEKGPDLGKILAAIGRQEALRRFEQALG
jgi:glutamyl/glutaminyl-tRNA synthetase